MTYPCPVCGEPVFAHPEGTMAATVFSHHAITRTFTKLELHMARDAEALVDAWLLELHARYGERGPVVGRGPWWEF